MKKFNCIYILHYFQTLQKKLAARRGITRAALSSIHSNAVVVDDEDYAAEDADDDEDYIDLSQFERVTRKPSPGGGGCNLGCDDADEEQEAADDSVSTKLADFLPSLPSFGSLTSDGGGDSETAEAGTSALSASSIAPMIFVSVLGKISSLVEVIGKEAAMTLGVMEVISFRLAWIFRSQILQTLTSSRST